MAFKELSSEVVALGGGVVLGTGGVLVVRTVGLCLVLAKASPRSGERARPSGRWAERGIQTKLGIWVAWRLGPT